MEQMRRTKFWLLLAILALATGGAWRLMAQNPSIEDQRASGMKALRNGNWKDAYNDLRAIALNPKNGGANVGADLENAITCLMRLGRSDEVDDFRESVIVAHAENWRLLARAAQTFQRGENYGFIVAGK